MVSQTFENLRWGSSKTFTIIFMGQFDGLLILCYHTHARTKTPVAKIDPMSKYSSILFNFGVFQKSPDTPVCFKNTKLSALAAKDTS